MERVVFDIQVGMPVYLEPTGNNRWNPREKGVRKGTVTKIGRAYFYVTLDNSPWEAQKFSKETFESFCRDCNAGWVLYESEKDYWEKELAIAKFCSMGRVFQYWNSKLSLKAIDQIYKILLDDGVIPESESVKGIEVQLETLG